MIMSEKKKNDSQPVASEPMSLLIEPQVDPFFELQKAIFTKFVEENPSYFGIEKNKPQKFLEAMEGNNEFIQHFLSACGYEEED